MHQLQTSLDLHTPTLSTTSSPQESQLSIPQIVVPHSSPTPVSSPLPISNSRIFSVLASPLPIRDVGSESLHPRPTSSFQTSISVSESFTSHSSQNLHDSSSSTIPVSVLALVTTTKPLHAITTKPIQPGLRNPTLLPPSLSPQDSFTPTIIASIVAIALALATMAGCTLIGCIALIHCKRRPHRVDSTGERDDKDTISMKDDSPLPGEVAS